MKMIDHFKWEIVIALTIKFTLFGLVWWLFFAGQNAWRRLFALENRRGDSAASTKSHRIK